MNGLYLPASKNPEAEVLAKNIEPIIKSIPPGVVARQFAISVMAEVNALSKRCDPSSVVKAAFNCAVIGLIPGAALGHCFFIPFDDKRRNKVICQLIIGYRGYLDLSYGCDFLRDIHTEVVLSGEKFRQWNDSGGAQIEHEISLDRELEKSNVIGAYCIYHTVAGGHGIAVVNRKQLNAVDTGRNVWRDDYISMAKKTPIRRAAKEWRITHRLGLALRLDEQAELGEEQGSEIELDGGTVKPLSLKDIPE